MAANTKPVYPRKGSIQWTGWMTAANTAPDMDSGTVYLVYTADATEGSWVEEIVFRPTPAGNTTQTVARLFVNNGGVTTDPANNSLIDEIDLPASAVDANNAISGWVRKVRKMLDPAYRLYLVLGTASANGWKATAFGGPL